MLYASSYIHLDLQVCLFFYDNKIVIKGKLFWHFLQEVDEWNRMSKSTKLERAIQNLRSELQKLEPPSKLVNLLNTPSANRISDKN